MRSHPIASLLFGRVAAALGAWLLVTFAGAAQGACPAEPGVAGTVSRAAAGDVLVLDSGKEVRIAGIAAPARLPGGILPAVAEDARAALDRLARGRSVTIRYWGPRNDRYDRIVGEVLLDGVSLGEILVGEGFARVWPPDAPEGCLEGLLDREKAARTAGLGLWRDPAFAVRSADDPSLPTQNGLYMLVEGRVASVGRGSRMVFLNFGRDWRRDFTVMVAAPVAARLVGEGKQRSLSGRRVLVRGIVEDKDGALIRVDGAGAIEVLEDDIGDAAGDG